MEENSYIFVERPSDLHRIGTELKGEEAIGVDLEADSMFHYREKVCLLQISTHCKNIIIDPLALEDISELSQIFADPGIRKVMHGADYDIRSLKRDFGFEVNTLFDTQIAAMFLGIRETGLANLLKNRLGVILEKKYQKKDWSERPLPKPMLEYAAKDASYLLSLANMLEEKLRTKGRLFCVEEECERLSKVRQNHTDTSPFFLKFKGAGLLDPRSLTVLETILKFRDSMAKKLDRPPYKVLANEQVNRLVREKPRGLDELREKGCLGHKQIRGFGRTLAKRIDRVLNLPEDSMLVYPRTSRRRVGHKAAKRVKALKKWREQWAGEMGLDPALICSNSQILSLAVIHPKTPEDLMGISDTKNWQRELFGREICRVLNMS